MSGPMVVVSAPREIGQSHPVSVVGWRRAGPRIGPVGVKPDEARASLYRDSCLIDVFGVHVHLPQNSPDDGSRLRRHDGGLIGAAVFPAAYSHFAYD